MITRLTYRHVENSAWFDIVKNSIYRDITLLDW